MKIKKFKTLNKYLGLFIYYSHKKIQPIKAQRKTRQTDFFLSYEKITYIFLLFTTIIKQKVLSKNNLLRLKHFRYIVVSEIIQIFKIKQIKMFFFSQSKNFFIF